MHSMVLPVDVVRFLWVGLKYSYQCLFSDLIGKKAFFDVLA